MRIDVNYQKEDINIYPSNITRENYSIDCIVLGKDCQIWILGPEGELYIVNVLKMVKEKNKV